MATANVQIKTITPEEAHYETAERMQDEIREIAVDQKRNFNEIKNDVSSIYDISIGTAITSILTILIIGIILININIIPMNQICQPNIQTIYDTNQS